MKIRGLMTSVLRMGVLNAGLLALCVPAMGQTSGSGPTESDMYCSGFVSKDAMPTNSKLVAGWDAPHRPIRPILF